MLTMILMVLNGLILIFLAAIRLKRSQIGIFELNRRADSGDAHAKTVLEREQLVADVLSLQQILISVFLVGFSILSVWAFDWQVGLLVGLIFALGFQKISRIGFVTKLTHAAFSKYEVRILNVIKKYSKIFKFFRNENQKTIDKHLSSKPELAHLVENAVFLSEDEKKLIKNSLNFDSRLVKEIMTARNEINVVSKNELLGPLVLNDLHTTGHSWFPVIDGDIDHVVGMFHIQDFLTIDGKKRSQTAEKAMDSNVHFVQENQTLKQALAVFIDSSQHLLVVVDQAGDTVGLISLSDVLEDLMGRKVLKDLKSEKNAATR